MQDKATGDLVTDHRAIAKRYLTGWFIVDLLATFPIDYIVRAVEVRDDITWHAGGASQASVCSAPSCSHVM